MTDAILARDPRWGICGVSLKTPRAIEALAPQDGLYSVLEKGADRHVGARDRVAFARCSSLGAERDRVVSPHRRSRASTSSRSPSPRRAIAMTRRPGASTGSTRTSSTTSRIPASPVSAIGVLAAGLAARRAAGAGPLTVVCCDNLPHNGRTVEGIVRAYAAGASTRRWRSGSARTSAFPCTMVDRIVPATTDDDIAEAARLLGVADAAPVVAEPFTSVGDRGPLRRRAPALGGRRSADRRRRRAVRDDEAAPAQRQPLDACVPRISGGTRLHLAGRERSAARGADRAVDDATRCCRRSPRRPGSISPRMPRRSARASATPRCRTARGRSRWTARRSCRSACSPRCASGSPRGALDRAISRSRSRAGSATRAAPTKQGAADRRRRPAGGADSRRSPTAASRESPRTSPTGFLDLVEVFGDDLSADPAFRRAVSRDVGTRCSATACAARSPSRRPSSIVGLPHGRAARPASRPAVPRRSRRPAGSRARSTRRSRTCRS